MTTTAKITDCVRAAYEGQYADTMREWRELGAKYKAENISALCRGRQFRQVLECGAGDGSVLQRLSDQRFCPELYAIEISEAAIGLIKSRRLPQLKEVHPFDGYTIPFEDGRFDLVILSHVLEHVEHPRILLREIRRVGRSLLVEVPLDYSVDVDSKVEHYLSYGHINVFTPSLLRFLLKSEGFAIVSDRLTTATREVKEFRHNPNKRRPPTARERVGAVCRRTREALRRLLTKPELRDEFGYDAYSVLCEPGGSSLKVFSRDA